MNRLLLAGTHALALLAGAGLGVYILPILIATHATPAPAQLASHLAQARWHGDFKRDLPGSDLLHWGEGRVSVGGRSVAFRGELAPGPDYKLYLSPRFVQTAQEFEQLKPQMVRLGDVRSFRGFVVPVPQQVDTEAYTTVVVWCETFSQFITAARYR